LGVDEVFLPKFLLKVLDLKLTTSAIYDFLKAPDIKKLLWYKSLLEKDASEDHINHCFYLPVTCTA
jgi:hypothetical protein